MFGQPNQPKTLTKIPLEHWKIFSVIRTKAVSNTPITVFGAAKGAESALNPATKYSEMDHLILVSPSAYAFSGSDFDQYGSSWIWKRNELPYVVLKRSFLPTFLLEAIFSQIVSSPIRYKAICTTAMDSDKNSESKFIPVNSESECGSCELYPIILKIRSR